MQTSISKTFLKSKESATIKDWMQSFQLQIYPAQAECIEPLPLSYLDSLQHLLSKNTSYTLLKQSTS